MGSRGLKPKSIYRPSARLEVFYTGGAVSTSIQGLVACACSDEIKLVDPATSSLLSTLAGDTEPVTALAFSPSGTRLYSASRSLQQKCWDVATGETLRSCKGHRGPVLALAVDPSGSLLASASADRSCRVWDTEGFYCTHAFHGHRGIVLQVVFPPKEPMVVTSGDDAEIRVWDLITKTCVATMKDHFSAVTSLSISADGWTLLSAGRDKVAILWDLRNHKKLVTVPVFEAVEGAAILPETSALRRAVHSRIIGSGSGKTVVFATGGERGALKLWRGDTGQCIYEQGQGLATREGQAAEAGEEFTELVVVPSGKGIMLATGDGRLLFYQAQEANGQQELHLARQLIGNIDEVTDLRLLGPPAAPEQLAVATNSPVIRLFDTHSLSCTATLTGHTDTVLVLDATRSKDGQTLLASGGKDNKVRVWSEAGACLGLGDGHAGAVSALAFSRRSLSFLITGGADKLLKVWDVSSLDASSSAELLSDRKLPQLRATAAAAAHDKDINAVAVSPNDALICSGSQDRTARVWRLPDLVQVLTLRGHRRGVWSVQFSPVEQCVLTSAGDATIRLWALADGSCLKTFEGHGASVLRALFISAGTQVVSAGADGLVKLWSVRTSECTATFDEHEGKVWALAAAGEDDGFLATGGADARVNVWRDCTAEDEATAAAERTETVLKAQDLANALKEDDYEAAGALAFELGQPGQLLRVVEAATTKGPEAAQKILGKLVAGLGGDQIRQCLEFVREWNTNSRRCHAAQATLQAILLQHSPEALLAVPGIGALLDGLAAYTQRHAARLDRLRRSVALLDYTLGSMHVVSPAADGEVTGRALPAAAAAVLPALNGAAGPARQPEGAPGPGVTAAANEHSSESELTSATGIDGQAEPDDEDDDEDELVSVNIDISSIERASRRPADVAPGTDASQAAAAGPSGRTSSVTDAHAEQPKQGKKRKAKRARNGNHTEGTPAAAEEAAAGGGVAAEGFTEQDRGDEGGGGAAAGTEEGHEQSAKKWKHKKQAVPKSSILTRTSAPSKRSAAGS